MRRIALLSVPLVLSCTYDEVHLTPPLKGTIEIDRPRGVLADGKDAALVRVRVTDYAGNELGDQVTVHFAARLETDAGDATSVIITPASDRAQKGVAAAHLTSTAPGAVIVTATLEATGPARSLPQKGRVLFVEQRVATATLAPPEQLAVGAQPSAVAAGDVNGDGKIDVVAIAWAARSLTTRLGNGSGRFDSPIVRALPASPRALVLGRVDADATLDAVVTLPQANQLAVLAGRGDGSFADPVLVATGEYPAALAAGDVNGDGLADVAVSEMNGGTIALLLSQASGPVQLATRVRPCLLPSAVLLARLDAGETIDLAVACDASGAVSLWTGDGQGGLARGADVTGTPASADALTAFTAGDLDGDRVADLITGAASGSINVRLGSSAESAVRPAEATAAAPTALTTADVNLDGHLDVVAAAAGSASPSGTLTVLLGKGDGSFDGKVELTCGWLPVSVAAADLDANGATDLLAADYGSSSISLLFNVARAKTAP